MRTSERPSDLHFRSNPRIPFQLSSERPKLRPPSGKPLIVQMVVNIEYWQFDKSMPRTIVVPPHGRSHIPDIPNFSWAEYGNRCGMPRLLKILTERKIPTGVSINASVIDVYPNLAKAVLDAGWEFIGHGIHQRALSEEKDEREMILGSINKLEEFTGKRPQGWMSPGWSETYDTPDLLEEAGIAYVCQWVVDDLPTWLYTKNGRIIAMPYGLDLNDSVIFAIEKHSSNEWKLRVDNAVQAFLREIDDEQQPRVLALPLHPHLSGVPHRIGVVADVLDTLKARNDTIFMTGAQIADWFTAEANATT